MPSPFLRRPFKILRLTIIAIVLFVLFDSFLTWDSDEPSYLFGSKRWHKEPGVEKAFVVASMKKENTTWLRNSFPDWQMNIYVVDDPDAELTVARNKGHEAMVYLSYIISNYHSLPTYTLFHHAARYQWHNDDPLYDSLPPLHHFRLEHLATEGYVNLRCVWVLGCPVEIRPQKPPPQTSYASPWVQGGNAIEGVIYANAWQELFPGVPVPQKVGVQCCAQFGVTRDQIRRRPLADYVRFKQWLENTELEDAVSGRIFEYSWHVIFGKEAVHCPSAPECYCKVFGLCDLKCENEKECEGRYILPPFSVLPNGWPRIGWEGEKMELPIGYEK